MSAEFEQLVAEFEKFQSKISNVDDRFAAVGEMQAELTQLEASATSPDRSITVVAGPGGSVKDIQFTEAALAQRPQALAAALMSTLREAVAESARKQATIVEEHMGNGMHLVDQVLETQAELFGTSVEELRSKMEEGAPRRTERNEDHTDYQVLHPGTEDRPSPPRPPTSGGSQGDRFLKNLFDEEDR